MLKTLSLCIALLVAYFLLWPSPIEPQRWQPPQAEGFIGPFKINTALSQLELLDIAGQEGPEGIAIGPDGLLYISTHGGWIIRFNPQTQQAERWVNTQGRPLGLAFNPSGDLIVADAFIGLLAIKPDRSIQLLSNHAGKYPIRYANSVDVMADSRIVFSDASTKFSAKAEGGTYPASLIDIMEHGGHGRLLMYSPATQQTEVLMEGFNFANGVALDAHDQFVLINETGHYRIHKYWLAGPKQGTSEILIENLPGFPDNITRGQAGRFWLGLASPRNPLIDGMADKPWLRNMVQRLPAFVRPKAIAYGHVIAISGEGEVLYSLQDPSGAYPVTTGVAETDDYLYVSSLLADKLGRLAKPIP